MNPIQKFEKWYSSELNKTNVAIPSACCLSTLGLDGFPNARFVSLKEIRDDRFVVTGPMNSRKGLEIQEHPRVALTFWWTETERQIRVQGTAAPISDGEADRYFDQRSLESRILATISNQGQKAADISVLEICFNEALENMSNKPVPKPDDWGGFKIDPIRIEFMQFRESRFHKRQLFTKNEDGWDYMFLQP